MNKHEAVKRSLESLREGDGLTPVALSALEHAELRQLLGTGNDTTAGVEVLSELARKVEGTPDGRPGKAIRNALAIDVPRLKNTAARRKALEVKLHVSESTIWRAERDGIRHLVALVIGYASDNSSEQPDIFATLIQEGPPLPPTEDKEPSKKIEQPQSKLHAFVMDAFRTSPVLSIALVAALSALVTLTGITLAPKLKDFSFKIGDGRVELDPKPSTSGTNLVLSKLEVANTGPASKDDTQGWGPERPTFTMKKPAPYLAFNSITDHPMHGDERNFVQCRDRNGNSWGTEVTALDGHIYQCYLWFDNALAPNLDDGNPAATLQGARAKIRLPKDEPNASLVGYLSAVNANTVWSSCRFTSSQPVTISYQRGTARIHTLPGVAVDGPRLAEKYKDGAMTSGIAASDGALLGEKKLDGRIQQTAGYILFDVKVSVKS